MANKKEFKSGLYAVCAGIVVAVILIGITIFAFTTRYTGFYPEKVAITYVDNIVQTGDEYNAYKNTLVSKNQKYGDFIINAYMKPYVNNGKDVKQADFVGTGEQEEIDKLDEVYSTMYDYYLELLDTYTMDDYDSVFSNYFAKLKEVRAQIYGDEYMDTEYMFGAFEANVSAYGLSLTGTDEVIAEDGKTILTEKTIGSYQTLYGEDYKLTTAVKEATSLSDDEVKAYVEQYSQRIKPVAQSGAEKADSFGLVDEDKNTPKSAMISAFEKLDCTDEISSVEKVTVDVTLNDGTVVATQEVYVVQIGNSWYVDNTNINTQGLYLV